ncbi:MAG: hypothetical protein IJ604_07150 [Prevotella sp.]|nr:hypothetical protein [Prevotella sp.]
MIDKMIKAGEVNFKKDFCLKYFDSGTWSLDVLNQVDVLLQSRRGKLLLYIESKSVIKSESEHREAIAQVILTNKKQLAILSRVALIYKDGNKNDVLELIDCSDDSVMYNNDINWDKEKASRPTRDAIDRINDRVKGRITVFRNEEIHDAYKAILKGRDVCINITEKNVNTVYNQWKNEIVFHEYIPNEQDLINLFLVDMLNRTVYKESVYKDIVDSTLFGKVVKGKREEETGRNLFREGTNLLNYRLMFDDGEIDGIKYQGYPDSYYYTIVNTEQYNSFWRRYKRPPEKHEFMKILEHSSMLYSEKYRRDTGGEYTPNCFVEVQNSILQQHYDMNEFIVCDPCAGVGNLENQFGKDFKQYCYLSTLVHMDVDTCRIKGFENSIQFDFLANDSMPCWKYKGVELDIKEIAKRENRKLMVVMNPPYQRKRGMANDLAIEFFNKVLLLQPDVIVYYCKTEFFLRENTMRHFVNSGYKVVSHIFSNAKDTFKLSEWAVSQVVFDRENGHEIDASHVTAHRYDYDLKVQTLGYVKSYTYDNSRPYLIKDIEKHIVENQRRGMVLGQWSYLGNVLIVSNGGKEKASKITTENLKYCLLSKGINFNTHAHYYEWNYLVYRGITDDIPEELFNDSLMFSLFYKNNQFSNKDQKNYIMPFTADELGCDKNDLNVLYMEDKSNQQSLFAVNNDEEIVPPFDFREFMQQFSFSAEARTLYRAALEVFRYYHSSKEYAGKDYNDSFYDITNAIMGKDVSSFRNMSMDKNRRITKVKTTKGTRGFSSKNIEYVIPGSCLPLFQTFFEARDALARKINRQLVEHHLLLWERENIF